MKRFKLTSPLFGGFSVLDLEIRLLHSLNQATNEDRHLYIRGNECDVFLFWQYLRDREVLQDQNRTRSCTRVTHDLYDKKPFRRK